ncbi:hypothetical protein C8R46DRAFT_288536 [Mycena filopes]|nr:hypothetical protein C8R46DRAFT_288536 [Mycena filopes]
MHPSLRGDNLNRLPPPIRRLAISASSGSLDELRRLQSLVVTPSEGGFRREFLLPVFYANLDPVLIPTDADLDLQRPALTRTTAAWISLTTLYDLEPRIRSEAYFELWPRVWAWVQLFDIYPHLVPDDDADDADDVCMQLFQIVGKCLQNIGRADLIDRTPNVRLLVVKGWRILLRRRPIDMDDFQDVSFFIGRGLRPQPLPAMHREEFIEGAGSPSDLVALAFEYLDLLLGYEGQQPALDLLLFPLMLFLKDLYDGPTGPFAAALISQAFPKRLAAMIVILNRLGIPLGRERTEGLIKESLVFLVRLSLVSNAHRVMSDALENGLLESFLAYATWAPGRPDPDQIETTEAPRNLLRIALPACMAYLPVVSGIEKALLDPDLKQIEASEYLDNVPLAEDWATFTEMAKERIQVLHAYWASPYRSLAACHNLECNVWEHRTSLFRCARCRAAYYCSKECQRVDWKEGDHRHGCESLRTRRRDPLTTRALSFMRFLIAQDSETLKSHIDELKIECTRANPSALVYLRFDYTMGRVAVEARPSSELNVDWAYELARARRSGGTMELHLMVAGRGENLRERMFPMRASQASRHGSPVQPARGVKDEEGETLN